MNPGFGLMFVFASFFCQVVVGTLIGAVILRAACSLFNLFSGGSRTSPPPMPSSEATHYSTTESGPYTAPSLVEHHDPRRAASGGVPVPDFGKACAIMFLTLIANAAIGFVLGLVMGAAGAARGADAELLPILALFVVIPIGFLVQSGLVAGMLPTSFGRALLVCLLYYLVTLVVVIAIIAVVFAVVAMMGLARA